MAQESVEVARRAYKAFNRVTWKTSVTQSSR
jgi:hypothetical protein